MGLRFNDDQNHDDDAIVAEINITPLTDVFLVLLIIFMISSTVMMEGGMNIKLPSAKSQTTLSDTSSQKPIVVAIGKDGIIQVQGKSATLQDIELRLREELAQSEVKTVIIRGDESVVLGSAVTIMDAARSAGADKIAVATQPKGKE